MIDALEVDGAQLPRRKTPPVLAAAGPPPPKATGDGHYEYVEFVPAWTDPDWKEEPTFWVPGPFRRKEAIEAAAAKAKEEGMSKDGDERDEKEKYVRKGDFTQRMRPALLAKDAHKNPTPYALRFGMNPHASQGRSRLSPTTSRTRKVALVRPQKTSTGTKDYVDMVDLKTEEQEHGGTAASLGFPNFTFREYLDFLSLTKADENHDMYRAFSDLRRAVDGDEDFQRFMFNGPTTDEVCVFLTPVEILF